MVPARRPLARHRLRRPNPLRLPLLRRKHTHRPRSRFAPLAAGPHAHLPRDALRRPQRLAGVLDTERLVGLHLARIPQPVHNDLVRRLPPRRQPPTQPRLRDIDAERVGPVLASEVGGNGCLGRRRLSGGRWERDGEQQGGQCCEHGGGWENEGNVGMREGWNHGVIVASNPSFANRTRSVLSGMP